MNIKGRSQDLSLRGFTLNMKTWILPALSLFSLFTARAVVIVPGATWTDTSGTVIQAHGGGFLKVGVTSVSKKPCC